MSDQVAEMSATYLVEAADNGLPVGYKQTEVGVIPEDWDIFAFDELVNYKKGFPFKSVDYQSSGVRIIRVSDTSYSEIKDESPIYISEKSVEQYLSWSLREGDLIFSTVGSKPPMYDSLVGKAIQVTCKHDGSLLNQNAVRIRAKSKAKGIQSLLLNHFRTERYIDFIEIIYRGNANQASITLENLFEFKIPLPCSKEEQAAIANALTDVDALISELEKLIAKKKAIKTATMQQLLTGRTRLPQFASHGDGKPKGYKKSELGEIPEDWEIVPFGSLLGIRHGKNQKAVEAENGKYPIFATGGQIGWANSYVWNKPSVLIGRKGTISKPRYAEKPFWTVDTLFYSEIKPHVNAKFIYFKFCMIDWMQYNEASGVPSLSTNTIENILTVAPFKEEQTAIANVLSDMDEEIQSLEQRLDKTRQIKQGMMQELLTGKTRLVAPPV